MIFDENMEYRNLFKPVSGLYVPSGWCIEKNHIFHLNKEGFEQIKNENYLFFTKEFYFDECSFYARSYPLEILNITYSGVVDIGCKLTDMNNFTLLYDINFWIYQKNKKKSKLTYEESCTSDNPIKALSLASEFMKEFSHQEIDFLKVKPIR